MKKNKDFKTDGSFELTGIKIRAEKEGCKTARVFNDVYHAADALNMDVSIIIDFLLNKSNIRYNDYLFKIEKVK